MLNIETYMNELIQMGVFKIQDISVRKGKLGKCNAHRCASCDFSGKFSCQKKVKEWLFSEYKEPEVDWSKVKVDTPILVRDFEKAAWERRYFAGFKDGEVYAWNGGLTSWTTDDEKNVCIWKYAKLAESEE